MQRGVRDQLLQAVLPNSSGLFFLKAYCDISCRQSEYITPLGVFSDAFLGHKMQLNLLTSPSIFVIWMVTHPSTCGAQCCLTLMIKFVPVCPAWHDAVFQMTKTPRGLLFVPKIDLATIRNIVHSIQFIVNNRQPRSM
jgi:hypothetical protein